MARSGWLCLFIVLLCRLSSKVSFIYNIPLKRNSGRSAGIQRKFVQSAEGGSSQKFFVGGPHLNNSVFCNVELNGANLQAVGFDMDFTLAQYKEEFNTLYFEHAKKHLHQKFGYPQEVLNFDFCSDKFCRGLIIDTKLGNILKANRQKYVCIGFHGFQPLSREQRKLYSTQATTFKEKHFVHVDTLFLLVNVILYSHVVELRSRSPKMAHLSFSQMYEDCSAAVDLCHSDPDINSAIINSPETFIAHDPGLVPFLQQLRESNKTIFLLTNSLWNYTDRVMDFVVHGSAPPGEAADWKDLFDLVIVGARKPAFLQEDYLSIFRINRAGELQNVEDKSSLRLSPGREGKVFQGGCYKDLHRLLNITFGDRVLYVGDHMFSDILRSKRSLGWRTCVIIPELEHELAVASRELALKKELIGLQQEQQALDELVDNLRASLLQHESVSLELQLSEAKSLELKKQLARVFGEYGNKFNKHWGQLFKVRSQDSTFAHQVADYACLYTSRVSNLRFVNPSRAFRRLQDFLPHDRALYDKIVLETAEADDEAEIDVAATGRGVAEPFEAL